MLGYDYSSNGKKPGEDWLTTLLDEHLRNRVASYLDPPSLCSFALTSRPFYAQYFDSPAFWGRKFPILCIQYGHFKLFRFAVEDLRAPFPSEEILIRASLSASPPLSFKFLSYIGKESRFAFLFDKKNKEKELEKEAERERKYGSKVWPGKNFCKLVARAVRTNREAHEVFVDPSFRSLFEQIESRSELGLNKSQNYLRFFFVYLVRENCFDFLDFLYKDGGRDEAMFSWESLVIFLKESDPIRDALKSDNIKMVELVRRMLSAMTPGQETLGLDDVVRYSSLLPSF